MTEPGITIRTAADELFEVVKKSKKISVEEVAKSLHMPLVTVQALVDFLVEEKVFGIEYKFTTPYVYVYKETIKEATKKDRELTQGLITKDQFYQKAKEKKIVYEQIEGMWRKYLRQNLVHIREQFILKAKEKKISDDKVEDLWNKYLSFL